MAKVIQNYDMHQHVNVDIKGSRKKAAVPVEQSISTIPRKGVYTIPIQTASGTSSIQNGNTVRFDLEPNIVGEIQNMYFRFKVSSSSELVILPGVFIVKEWTLKTRKGSGDQIAKWYPENIIQWLYALPKPEREMWESLALFHSQEMRSWGVYNFTDKKNLKLYATDAEYVYVPIPLNFFHNGAIDMAHIKETLTFFIQFNDDWVISGTEANLSLDETRLIIHSQYSPKLDEDYRLLKRMKQPHKYIYLDCARIQVNNKTLTAGSKSQFSLDDFAGYKVAYLIVCIRDGTGPAASDRSLLDFVPLHGSTLDITDSGGVSLLGHGTPLRENELYEMYSNVTGDKPVKGLYIIPLCENFHKAMLGQVNGFYGFSGRSEQLAITFSAAGTAHVLTLTEVNAGNDGGFFRVVCGGQSTDSQAHDQTAANLKTAVEALDPIASRDFEVTFNGTLEATTLITFNARNGNIEKELGKNPLYIAADSLTDGAVASKIAYTHSTNGVGGFTTSASYETSIYAMYYKRICIDEYGKIYSERL